MIRTTILVLLVCGSAAAFGEWNTYHGGADLRGTANAVLPKQPELLWRYDAGGPVYNSPVSDGERIFISAQKGTLMAVDLNGSKLWENSITRTNAAGQAVPVRFEAPLLYGNGAVFAGSTQGILYALDAKTGGKLWQYNTGGIIIGSPNFVQGVADRKDTKKQRGENHSTLASSRLNHSALVVLDQAEGALHCLESSSGRLLWKTEGVERCDGAPGLGNDRIVFGSCLAALHVYSTKGKHLKDIEVGGDGQIAGGVAVDGLWAYAGTRDGSLVCADMNGGDIVWSSDESEDQTFSTPAVTEKMVIYSSDNGFVYALHRADGALAWKFDTGGSPTSPVVAKNRVVVCADGTLYVLELESGRQLWSREVSDEASSPALIDNMIVVGADDGTVTAWGAP
jgi:outer membrane protein assembly factor BamB